MSAIRRADLGPVGITFHRPNRYGYVAVWRVQYPNGWVRRTLMDKDGKAVLTRWIRPEGDS